MLADLTKCEIILVPQVSQEEISDLIKREEITSLANSRFAKGEISFQDYIDCLEVVGVCIDDYLLTVENNLTIAGVL
ncbi:hypothetical protein [Nostoc sp. DedQUE09]|uniref:hypothetical protein n=1 Tax=Nostoc sp. DedQUE09 TaxID=3075394 RepID=UPI002AD4BD18|nr:hypothetical protein [Nostoc sp. DedQUE09]MDZ7953331.1 hypothetical protein [Nostoc sp. DedQUE09]MDZ7953359.1 hypothetical protein [Nostoc sp. DedQUE09]